MIKSIWGSRADGRPLIYREGCHVLCVGTTGSGKSKLADALLYGLLRDVRPQDDIEIVVNNPKMVGFEWVRSSPRVRLYDDLSKFEGVWVSVWEEVMRRYSVMEFDGCGTRRLPESMGPLFVFNDELPSMVGNEGALLPPASVKSIKDSMLKVLRLGRQARVYVFSFSQFAEGGNVGGTAARNLYDNRICMRVTSNSEVAMATGISESELGSDNLTAFLSGEVLARMEKGTPFVRGWADYYEDRELIKLLGTLEAPKEPDFNFLKRRKLA